jgi:4-hydroxybenzoyl-CoA thioesterase
VFRTTILVRFGDLDAAGIAYYPNLVNFLHEAFEDFFVGHVGTPYPEAFKEGLASPTVKLEMEFLSPVRYGDHVDIGVAVEHVGRTSLRVRYQGSVGGRPVFAARNTMVIVDMATFRPTPIPGWLRERLEAALDPGNSGGEPGAGEE